MSSLGVQGLRQGHKGMVAMRGCVGVGARGGGGCLSGAAHLVPTGTSSDFWPLSKDRQDFAGRTLVVWPHPLPAVTRLSPRSSHGHQQRRRPSHGPPPGKPPAGSVWEQCRALPLVPHTLPGVPCPMGQGWRLGCWMSGANRATCPAQGVMDLVWGLCWSEGLCGCAGGAKCVAQHCRTVVVSGHGGGLFHGAGGVGTRGCAPGV